jgi:hypothetical protein
LPSRTSQRFDELCGTGSTADRRFKKVRISWIRQSCAQCSSQLLTYLAPTALAPFPTVSYDERTSPVSREICSTPLFASVRTRFLGGSFSSVFAALFLGGNDASEVSDFFSGVFSSPVGSIRLASGLSSDSSALSSALTAELGAFFFGVLAPF